VTAFAPSGLVTQWVVSPFGTVLALAASLAYAAILVALRRRGDAVPVLRPLTFYLVGIGSLVLATDGGLAAFRDTSFVAAAAQSAVLAAITPVGIALGDPLGLARRALGERGATVLDRVVTGRTARIVMFPLLASVVATGLHLALFVTPWLAASVEHGWVRELTYAVLLGSGLLFVLPLLADELVPAWCTAGVRVLIAFGDGLLDAVPGVVVMASPALLGTPVAAYLAARDPLWKQWLGCGAMFGVAEVVGLPLLAATILVWVRSDAREAALVDAQLDREEAQRLTAQRLAAQARQDSPDTTVEVPSDSAEGLRDRPWWETDPRFTRRAP
jgi:putative copper resistance protein D